MTPRTRNKYKETLNKARTALLPIQLGDCEPLDLFAQPEMHLLMLEGFERLTAVVVEGTGFEVCWAKVSGSA